MHDGRRPAPPLLHVDVRAPLNERLQLLEVVAPDSRIKTLGGRICGGLGRYPSQAKSQTHGGGKRLVRHMSLAVRLLRARMCLCSGILPYKKVGSDVPPDPTGERET